MANEEDTAVAFVEEMLRVAEPFRETRFLAVLDRASTDRTREILEAAARSEPRLEVIWAPENRCAVDAYLRGYREAIDRRYDWILEIDAGFSHAPDDFRGFFPFIEAGKDCVFGSRYGGKGLVSDTPLKRRMVSRGGTAIANLALGTRLSDMTSGFQLFRRPALETILERGIRSRAHFFQTEMKFHARDLDIAEVPITYRSPSPSLKLWVLRDAARNFGRLIWDRLRGRT